MNTTFIKSASLNKLSKFLETPEHPNSKMKKDSKTNQHQTKQIHHIKHMQIVKQDKKQDHSNTFYDSFQFVDRLTNNKLSYKEAGKNCSSSLQSRKNTSKMLDKSHLNDLLSIYKKTKNFEMKNLKKRIFKNITHANENINESDNQELKRVNSSTSIKDRKKTLKRITYIPEKSTPAEYFLQRSQKKNKLRSFIDKTINEINKDELMKIKTEGDFNIKEQILSLNGNRNKIKCDLNKNEIDQLIYLRQKQQFQLGITNSFQQKPQQIMFKQIVDENFDSQNKDKNKQSESENQPNKSFSSFQLFKKKKKIPKPKFQELFMEKMMNYTKSYIKKQCQYLITPSRENQRKNMLFKSSKNKYAFNQYRKSAVMTELVAELSAYSFDQKQECSMIKELKNIVKIKQNQNIKNPGLNQDVKGKNQKQKQKQLLNLLKTNCVSNLSLQLTESVVGCMARDEKGNNLLHLAIKQELPQVIQIIFNKLNYKTCMQLLAQRNNTKRTPLDLGKLLVNRRAVEIIEQFLQRNKKKPIIQNWLNPPTGNSTSL